MPTKLRFKTSLIILAMAILAPRGSIAQGCIDAPGGLLGWWPGDDDADDYACASISPLSAICSDGVLVNGAGFGPVIVGNGFSLDGVDDYVRVVDSVDLFDFDETQSFSWDAWVMSASFGTLQTVLSKEDGDRPTFNLLVQPDGRFSCSLQPNQGGTYTATSSLAYDRPYVARYVACVADRVDNTLTLYVNRQVLGQTTFPAGATFIENSTDLLIGARRPQAPDRFFHGLIDEVGVYRRALTAEEIAATYDAAIYGKCKAPIITAQPTPQTSYSGCCALLTVDATGFRNEFQWRKDGVALVDGGSVSGTQSPTLTFSSIMPADAGSYTVEISNNFSTVLSDNALLEVPNTPECQIISCDPAFGCILTPESDGTSCDDGSACSIGDVCTSGVCAAGPPLDCNDGNPCTNDSCDTSIGCINEHNTIACDDGEVCTTNDKCFNGSCLGSQVCTQSQLWRVDNPLINSGGDPEETNPSSTNWQISFSAMGDGHTHVPANSTNYRVQRGTSAIYTAPDSVTAVSFSDLQSLNWNPELLANSYNVYRGLISGGFPPDFGACLFSTTATTASITDSPPVNDAYFYLVTAVGILDEEGSKGMQSNGSLRLGTICP